MFGRPLVPADVPGVVGPGQINSGDGVSISRDYLRIFFEICGDLVQINFGWKAENVIFAQIGIAGI